MIGAGCSCVGELSSETGKAPEFRGDGCQFEVLEVEDGTHQPTLWEQKGLSWPGAQGEEQPQAVLEQPPGRGGDLWICGDGEWAGGNPCTQRRQGEGHTITPGGALPAGFCR